MSPFLYHAVTVSPWSLSVERNRFVRAQVDDPVTPAAELRPDHVMPNPGGDGLGAVIAVGAARGVAAADHWAIARHPRYRHEGHL